MSKKRREKTLRRLQRERVQAARRNRDESPDKRSIFAEVTEIGSVPVAEPHLAMVVEPIRHGEDLLMFQAPFLEVLYLLKAKALRDGAEPKRAKALAATKRGDDGALRPLNPTGAFDALEDLALCVILSAAAIEAYANGAIGRLPDDAMVETKERAGGKTIPVMRNKAFMDFMRLSDKLSLAVPVLTGNQIKGKSTEWQNFRRIARLRNKLVHVKREAYNDPDKPGPFGRLLLGEASTAPEDTASVIEALEPGWIPTHVRAEVGLA